VFHVITIKVQSGTSSGLSVKELLVIGGKLAHIHSHAGGDLIQLLHNVQDFFASLDTDEAVIDERVFKDSHLS